MRRRFGTCVGLLVLLALGGCGSSSSKQSGLTGVQLDVRSGAICSSADRQLTALPTPDLNDPQAVATALETVDAIYADALAKLGALKAGFGDAGAYKAFVADVGKERAFYRTVQAKARAKDPSGLSMLQGGQRAALRASARAAATKAGLARCAATLAPEGAGGATHRIVVTYDPPKTKAQAVAKSVLKLGALDKVADTLGKRFKLPVDITVHVRNDAGSPNYDPSTKTVNLYYDFVDETATILEKGIPHITQYELGKQLAAIDGFVFIHELGHGLVDVFSLPITGREEDAVDGLATVFFTDDVPNGLEYAFDIANFWRLLQSVQGVPDVTQFEDEHSLSIQRAYDIVCAVAGASDAGMKQIARRHILSATRLARCPAEHAQQSRAWTTLLRPYLRS